MAEWVVERRTDPRAFPVVHHRHPNGTLDAVRERTPVIVGEPGRPRIERWAYACPCGEVWAWERGVTAT